MRGKCVRHRIKQKSVVLRSPQSHTTTRANISHEKAEQIRARIVCTPAEKEWRGREFSPCADGTIKIKPISLCLHPVPHPNLNREVRRSLIWHSSKSESALERFEPVAADKLRLDGSLAMFAPEGDGCLNRARREDAGRIHKAGTTLCDFCRAFRQ